MQEGPVPGRVRVLVGPAQHDDGELVVEQPGQLLAEEAQLEHDVQGDGGDGGRELEAEARLVVDAAVGLEHVDGAAEDGAQGDGVVVDGLEVLPGRAELEQRPVQAVEDEIEVPHVDAQQLQRRDPRVGGRIGLGLSRHGRAVAEAALHGRCGRAGAVGAAVRRAGDGVRRRGGRGDAEGEVRSASFGVGSSGGAGRSQLGQVSITSLPRLRLPPFIPRRHESTKPDLGLPARDSRGPTLDR